MPLITDKMMYSAASGNVVDAQVRLQKAHAKASTGVRIAKAGDDPAAAAHQVLLDASIGTLEAQRTPHSAAEEALSGYENDMSGMLSQLSRAKALATQASSESTGIDRAVMSNEVGSMYDYALALANGKDAAGNYRYAGFQESTAPFDAAGTYSGDGGQRVLEVAPNLSAVANLRGDEAFNPPGGTNVIGVLRDFKAALTANDVPAIRASMTKIDAAITQTTQMRTQLGGQQAILVMANDMRISQRQTLQTSRASVVEADMVASYSDMAEMETAYSTAIKQAGRILQALQQGAESL